MEENRRTDGRNERNEGQLSNEDRGYNAKKRALFRKIVDACDECGLTTASVISTLKDVSDQINLCRNSKPMEHIMDEMRKSKFYRDS